MNTVIGDLLDFPTTFICHGCNTMNTMGAGLAKQIVVRYPQALIADTSAHKAGTAVLGSISVAQIYPDKWSINLYQQDEFGKLNLLALEKALIRALDYVLAREEDLQPEFVFNLGVPYKIGCGLARGNWTEVLALLSKLDITYPNRITIVQREQDT